MSINSMQKFQLLNLFNFTQFYDSVIAILTPLPKRFQFTYTFRRGSIQDSKHIVFGFGSLSKKILLSNKMLLRIK